MGIQAVLRREFGAQLQRHVELAVQYRQRYQQYRQREQQRQAALKQAQAAAAHLLQHQCECACRRHPAAWLRVACLSVCSLLIHLPTLPSTACPAASLGAAGRQASAALGGGLGGFAAGQPPPQQQQPLSPTTATRTTSRGRSGDYIRSDYEEKQAIATLQAIELIKRYTEVRKDGLRGLDWMDGGGGGGGERLVGVVLTRLG